MITAHKGKWEGMKRRDQAKLCAMLRKNTLNVLDAMDYAKKAQQSAYWKGVIVKRIRELHTKRG